MFLSFEAYERLVHELSKHTFLVFEFFFRIDAFDI